MTGQTISHYRVLEKLGEGGMGVVYRAEDLKLHRFVALKFLPAPSPDLRARFLAEAESAAALNHPNVCTIHEFDDEHWFLAMELIEGETVAEKIRARPLPFDEAVGIAIQAGQGLQAAHEKGIVHRDIKSGNVMVTRSGQVKVMDFGLARMAEQTRVTRPGTVLGTPSYMSPEQAQGQTVDHRTDIWALGVVVYEMVTGRLPFPGHSRAEVVHSILHVEPEPLTALRSGVPMELDRIVEKALRKDPGERYQHVEDLLVDLRGLRRAADVPGKARRAVRPWYAAVAIATMLLVAFGWFMSRHEAPPQATEVTVAVLPLNNLSGDPEQDYFSDGMTEELITDLAGIQTLRVISRTSVMRYKDSRRPLPEIAQELNATHVVEGSVLRVGDRVRVTAQLIDAAADRHL